MSCVPQAEPARSPGRGWQDRPRRRRGAPDTDRAWPARRRRHGSVGKRERARRRGLLHELAVAVREPGLRGDERAAASRQRPARPAQLTGRHRHVQGARRLEQRQAAVSRCCSGSRRGGLPLRRRPRRGRRCAHGRLEGAALEGLPIEPRRPTVGPPAAQPFWTAKTTGTNVSLTWPASEGTWSIVVMNADASAGVAADLDLGVKVNFLGWVALGLLIVGGILVLAGVALMFFGFRSPRAGAGRSSAARRQSRPASSPSRPTTRRPTPCSFTASSTRTSAAGCGS